MLSACVASGGTAARNSFVGAVSALRDDKVSLDLPCPSTSHRRTAAQHRAPRWLRPLAALWLAARPTARLTRPVRQKVPIRFLRYISVGLSVRVRLNHHSALHNLARRVPAHPAARRRPPRRSSRSSPAHRPPHPVQTLSAARHPDTMPATTILSRAGAQLSSRGSIALRGAFQRCVHDTPAGRRAPAELRALAALRRPRPAPAPS